MHREVPVDEQRSVSLRWHRVESHEPTHLIDDHQPNASSLASIEWVLRRVAMHALHKVTIGCTLRKGGNCERGALAA